jgi:2-oxoisovalerate dehydrogenase E1 component
MRRLRGSQHLQHQIFYSNGIQGGMTPIACGAAYSEKMCNENNISVVFIGDGTLGQGVLYEAQNIAGWLKLPILFILEDNGIAQSTLTKSFNYSDLNGRVSGFNLDYFETCTDDWNGLEQVLGGAVKDVRQNKPSFVRIKSRRLMSHSKGDDNRDEIIRDSNFANDPLNEEVSVGLSVTGLPQLVGRLDLGGHSLSQKYLQEHTYDDS